VAVQVARHGVERLHLRTTDAQGKLLGKRAKLQARRKIEPMFDVFWSCDWVPRQDRRRYEQNQAEECTRRVVEHPNPANVHAARTV